METQERDGEETKEMAQVEAGNRDEGEECVMETDKEGYRRGNKGRREATMAVEGKDHWKGKKEKERERKREGEGERRKKGEQVREGMGQEAGRSRHTDTGAVVVVAAVAAVVVVVAVVVAAVAVGGAKRGGVEAEA
jgi:hypothetical protein